MKGYIVGYLEEWGLNMNPMIVGYYTSWNKALNTIKMCQRNNLANHGGLWEVYLVEIEVNRTYPPQYSDVHWFTNFPHHIVEMDAHGAFLKSSNPKRKVYRLDL